MVAIPKGGYAGKILRVDLTRQSITEESLDEATLRKYIGGTGLGARFLYEEVPPGVEWSDAQNRIMFFTGPLAGGKMSGSGTFSVVSKGPMTNMGGASQANGFFGAYLKHAGVDGIVVQGRASQWQYLYIHDGTAELRDAAHLRGKGTWETEDAVKETIKGKSSVFTIGPAGENLVRFACIVGDHGHVAAHNGLGAVMGSKKLKAIAVQRGSCQVPVADPQRYQQLVKSFNKRAVDAQSGLAKWGTAEIFPVFAKIGQLPVKNYTTSIFPDAEKFGGEYLRTHFKATPTTCWACRLSHCAVTEVTEGPYKGFKGEEPEYEGLAAMGSVIGVTDPGATVMLANWVDRIGIDINESGYLIGWVMECFQKGLLKKADLDGIEIPWGDAEAVLALLKKIGTREGIGDLLAEGVKRAAEKIGGEALQCAVFTHKGASPRGHDHRARWAELMDTCLSNTGTVEAGPGIPAPDQIGLKPLKDPFDAMEVSTLNARVNGRRQFEDSLGVCFFCLQNLQEVADLLNAVTGWDFDIWEAMRVGKRIVNLMRMFAFRHGLHKELEAPSLRYGSSPIDGPAQGKHIMPHWDALRSNYYTHMGWDPETGKPLPDTLKKLGLSYLKADLP